MTTTPENELEKAAEIALSTEVKTDLQLIEAKRADLTELVKTYSGLTINGIDDEEGIKAVTDARKKVVSARTEIEGIREEYTAQFERKKKAAIALEKELVGIIKDTEEHLKSEEARIKQLKQDKVDEEIRKNKERLSDRIRKLADFGATADLFTLENIDEPEYQTMLETARKNFEEANEKKRLEELAKAEQEKKDAEARAKLEAEQKALDEERIKIQAEREKMDAERAAIEKEKADKIAKENEEKLRIEREAELKKAQEEAAEKARVETEARIKREAEEKAAAEKAEAEQKAEAERIARETEEANEKFKKWLSDNGVTAENKSEHEVRNENGARVLYRRISTYQA